MLLILGLKLSKHNHHGSTHAYEVMCTTFMWFVSLIAGQLNLTNDTQNILYFIEYRTNCFGIQVQFPTRIIHEEINRRKWFALNGKNKKQNRKIKWIQDAPMELLQYSKLLENTCFLYFKLFFFVTWYAFFFVLNYS